jgi:predicted TIM-barrel fold metal-dependent hydrolase
MVTLTTDERAADTRTRYYLIDGDTHVNEPPDLWTNRVPAKYRDRVPRLEHLEDGDAWIIEGVKDPINFGMNACAGLPAEKQQAWIRFDELREGGWNPAARLKEMDQDGIDAAFLYPTPRLSQGVVSNRDADLQLAMIQAYNDWLSEYASHAPKRLFGLGMLPICGVGEAVKEYERIVGLPGLRGAVMLAYPHGTDAIAPEDDDLFAAVVASGVPLNIHAAMSVDPPTVHKTKIPGDVRFYDAPKRMLEFLWAGVFDRFPALRLGFIEVDCGWVPVVKEQIDNRYYRMAVANRLTLRRAPSEYFDEHCFYSFITDTFGIDNRHAVGVENMLWSSDYPHVGADWPNSRRTIEAAMAGVPKAERELILWGNAVRLYGL